MLSPTTATHMVQLWTVGETRIPFGRRYSVGGIRPATVFPQAVLRQQNHPQVLRPFLHLWLKFAVKRYGQTPERHLTWIVLILIKLKEDILIIVWFITPADISRQCQILKWTGSRRGTPGQHSVLRSASQITNEANNSVARGKPSPATMIRHSA